MAAENLQSHLVIHDVRQDQHETWNTRTSLLTTFVNPVSNADRFPLSQFQLMQSSGSVVTVTINPQQGVRSLPTEILYGPKGISVFNEITHLESEYYLTRCEKDILNKYGNELASIIDDGATLIELGCGSMEKTAVVLNALKSSGRRNITFLALDIEEASLRESLAELIRNDASTSGGDGNNAYAFEGILGSYTQALKKFLRRPSSGQRVFLWLGSSIGNFSRRDGTELMKMFQEFAMSTGDLFLCGMDRRNDAKAIALAYNDTRGITSEFGMCGLEHLNDLLGQRIFDRSRFEYFSGYNSELGRHEAYYRSLQDQSIEIPAELLTGYYENQQVRLKKHELISFEFSYKYSEIDVFEIANGCEFNVEQSWFDESARYAVRLFKKPPIRFDTKARSHYPPCPTVHEWNAAWKCWDLLTSSYFVKDYLDRPIDLRLPYIFYVGHNPTFCDILLSKSNQSPRTVSDYFVSIFERGTDPIVEDPSQCHNHSVVPDTWPSFSDILKSRDLVRARVLKLTANSDDWKTARGLFLAFEHEMMHAETLMHMHLQNIRLQLGSLKEFLQLSSRQLKLDGSQWLSIEKSVTTIGQDDPEGKSGWDNENPALGIDVEAFQIQSRPVSVGEYLSFLSCRDSDPKLVPATWHQESNKFKHRTVFGLVDIEKCLNWPVCINYNQSQAYLDDFRARSGDHSLRIPTEAELVSFYDAHQTKLGANFGFTHWHPLPLSDTDIHVMGSLWEWTSTVFESRPGFKASELYPGYSADFFDGLHNVVRGASWATHGRMAGRLRNFYQRAYPYAFIGVRFVRGKQ